MLNKTILEISFVSELMWKSSNCKNDLIPLR